VIAMPCAATWIAFSGVSVARLIGVIVVGSPLMAFESVTYAVLPLGVMAILPGFVPTLIGRPAASSARLTG